MEDRSRCGAPALPLEPRSPLRRLRHPDPRVARDGPLSGLPSLPDPGHPALFHSRSAAARDVRRGHPDPRADHRPACAVRHWRGGADRRVRRRPPGGALRAGAFHRDPAAAAPGRDRTAFLSAARAALPRLLPQPPARGDCAPPPGLRRRLGRPPGDRAQPPAGRAARRRPHALCPGAPRPCRRLTRRHRPSDRRGPAVRRVAPDRLRGGIRDHRRRTSPDPQ